jgi:hypothetical protein
MVVRRFDLIDCIGFGGNKVVYFKSPLNFFVCHHGKNCHIATSETTTQLAHKADCEIFSSDVRKTKRGGLEDVMRMKRLLIIR